jgi:hypothetical protein
MHILYCDESNLEERPGDFFVYGGCVFEGERAYALSQKIEELRKAAKLPEEYVLKFNPKPDHLNHQQFLELKQAIIEAAASANCIFIASLILHDIATSADQARRNAINTVCYHFDCYLNRPKSHGLVLVDRFEDGKIDAHLREKFATGVTGLPYSPRLRLERIIGFHYSAIGQSNFGSIVDIILGSFRYAVNAFTRKDEKAMPGAKAILAALAPLFFRESSDGAVSEISLMFSPKAVKSDKYRSLYDALIAFLAENGIVASQKIASEVRY